MTSAPKSDRIVAAAGAAMKLPQSITFKPSNKSPILSLPLFAHVPVWKTRLQSLPLLVFLTLDRLQRAYDGQLLRIALGLELLGRRGGERRVGLRDNPVLRRLIQIDGRHVLPRLVETRTELLEERFEAAGSATEMERAERTVCRPAQ